MKPIIAYIFMFLPWATQAQTVFPYQCKPMAITEATIKLPSGAPGLVLLQNTSEGELWIAHPISDPGASAGWSSRLQSQHWSAFALGEKTFELSCIESKPGHEQQIPCSKVISACQWSNIKTTEKQSAPYWASENMSLSELEGHLAQRGFRLPERIKE